MSRSPLTETFKRVQGMVFYVQENLSAEEYMLFLDMVDPQPEPEAPAKKTRKKRTTRSARAQSLSTVIQESVGKPHLGDGPVCTACFHTEDYEDHQQPSPHYHPFAPPAPAVAGKSRRKGAVPSPMANTETGGEGVIAAAAAQ